MSLIVNRPLQPGDKPQSREEMLTALYDSMVHGLRSQGWSRLDAETEAENRIDRLRQIDLQRVRDEPHKDNPHA